MAEPVCTPPAEGSRKKNPVGGQVAFKVRGDQSGGRMTALESVVAPGDGPPLHVHAYEDETLYVLEGVMRFKLGEALHTGPAGSYVFIPRGTQHAFQNVGNQPARMLVHFSPSGMERFFEGFAALDDPDAGAFSRIGAEVGMTVLGPPLAQSNPVA